MFVTSWQPSLLDPVEAPRVDAALAGIERRWLDERSWVEVLPAWVQGAAVLFDEVLEAQAWGQRRRPMYERMVDEPRLTAHWSAEEGEAALRPAFLHVVGAALSAHYGVAFDSVGCNLYRDARDSVAWHADRIARTIAEPLVALVSLGARRPFQLRPKGGGHALAIELGQGDLLVTGGRCQRDWEHAVPKLGHAVGPRISLAWRHSR